MDTVAITADDQPAMLRLRRDARPLAQRPSPRVAPWAMAGGGRLLPEAAECGGPILQPYPPF